MKNIIKDLVFLSNKGNAVTNSLLVAKKFEKEHRHVLEALRNLITTAENPAVLSMFYETTYLNEQNKKQPMFIMNRDGFTLLSLRFTGKKALNFQLDFISAFNKMEEALKNQKYLIPQNYPEALELAAQQARELDEKNRIIEKQAPAVDFVNRAVDSGHLTDIGQACKILKLKFGRNTFFRELRDKGILFKGRNEPKQEYINRGYFELREKEITRNDHPPFMVTKVLVTQKGLVWLARLFEVSYIPKIRARSVESIV